MHLESLLANSNIKIEGCGNEIELLKTCENEIELKMRGKEMKYHLFAFSSFLFTW